MRYCPDLFFVFFWKEIFLFYLVLDIIPPEIAKKLSAGFVLL